MLEKKLKEARQDSSKLNRKAMIAIMIVIVACILILVSLQNFKFILPKENPLYLPEEKKLSDSEKIRSEFTDLFKQYKKELKPRLQEVNLKQWNQNALFEINDLENKIMLSFSKSNYRNALENTKLLRAYVIAILDKSEQIFKKNIEKATLFYSDDNYDKASLHIEKSLVVAPQSVEALELQKDIEKLLYILPLLKRANTARAEHNLINELNFLQQIIKINPKRVKEARRYNYLKQKIKSKNFEMHILLAITKLQNNKITEARSHYENAKKIDPERKELDVLMNRISEIEKAYSVQEFVRKAEAAARQDNWLQAKIGFADVLKVMPKHEIAVIGLRRSNKILEIQENLDQHIESPYRLTDGNVLVNVKKILMQAKKVSEYSPKIENQIDKLNRLIATFNRLIPVTVRSDNMTDIKVRGIGKLGVVLHKTIHLKPGNYVFEGSRNGFKSKLLQVTIPYYQNNYSVSIICDESI